ncbi:hypothetical protein N2152v2_007720 [Parachlorella kessleri]
MGPVLQVVTGDGQFNTDGVEEFVRANRVDTSGVRYNIVAITGPQSSGKSTLLNHVFGTSFEEMDAMTGRHQTTRGIWLAMAPKVEDPPTLVLDLEGSDGRERGEDDTSFERQSALFALAVADIVLVNMWAKDIGRETGSGKPLLKTIFQVNLKLFQPAPNRRRTLLLFVFRDRTKTPLSMLTQTWEADLGRMWDAITKPPQYEHTKFTDFFEVAYSALPNYEERTEDFRADAVMLRRKFSDEEEGSFLRPSEEKLPGHALALSMAKVWEVVREHKDLNLPAHRVMVANIRCEEIAAEQLEAFRRDQAWVTLEGEAGQDLVPTFGASLADLLDSCLEGYDEEARYFEHSVSEAKRDELLERLHSAAKPAFEAQLAIVRELALDLFKQELALGQGGGSAGGPLGSPGGGEESFVQRAARCSADAMESFDSQAAEVAVPGTDWETAPAREQLEHEIAAHIQSVRLEAVGAALTAAQKAAGAAVSAGAVPLLETPPQDLWPRLAKVLARASHKTQEQLDVAVEGYGVEGSELEELHSRLAAAARAQLVSHAREAANTALSRIKDRFNEVFQRDEQGMPRTWAPSVDIPAVALEARRAAALLLSQLAAARLGDQHKGRDPIEASILALARPVSAGGASDKSGSAPSAAAAAGNGGEFDVLSASEWPEGAAGGRGEVLLAPPQCRTVWRQFSSESTLAVQQAMATQEANRAAQNRMPPLWAIAAMVVLGFNEFMAVLYNPLLLITLLLLFLFGRTVYQELDVESEMQRGLLPGLMSLSAKFVPTFKAVASRTFESTKHLLQEAPPASGSSSGGGGSDTNFAASSASGGGGGAAAAPARRSSREAELRRRKEVELSGSGSAAQAGGSAQGRSSRFGEEVSGWGVAGQGPSRKDL